MAERNEDEARDGSSADCAIRVAIIARATSPGDDLRALIEATPEFHCYGSFGTVEEAIEQMSAELPDVAMIEIAGMRGIADIRMLKERFGNMPIIALGVNEEEAEIFEAISAGADGYILRKTPPLQLLKSLKEACEGGSPMSPEVARRVVGYFRRYEQQSGQFVRRSRRG